MRSPTKKGYIGVQCRARFCVTEDRDGSFLTIFRGYHNHDCQKDYLLHISPIHTCKWLQEQVDRKLHSGLTNAGDILASLQQTGCDEKYVDRKFETHEQARAYYMTSALDSQMIRNRRLQLGLVDPHITNKDDATSVANLVTTWKRKKGDASPVRYYKARGHVNDDTSEEEKSPFTKNDFLLVLQTPEQAKMMRDNPVLLTTLSQTIPSPRSHILFTHVEGPVRGRDPWSNVVWVSSLIDNGS